MKQCRSDVSITLSLALAHMIFWPVWAAVGVQYTVNSHWSVVPATWLNEENEVPDGPIIWISVIETPEHPAFATIFSTLCTPIGTAIHAPAARSPIIIGL